MINFYSIFKKINKHQKGVSLVELIVATAIFGIVIFLINDIYLNVMRAQKDSIAAQTTQEALRFAFEMMSKEIRSAKGDFSGSTCASGGAGYNKIFNNESNNHETAANKLYFKNKDDACVVYEEDSDRLKITRGANNGYITPNEIKIVNLKFLIDDTKSNEVGLFQPSVTISVEAEMLNGPKQNIKMQTTVSSRNYKY